MVEHLPQEDVGLLPGVWQGPISHSLEVLLGRGNAHSADVLAQVINLDLIEHALLRLQFQASPLMSSCHVPMMSGHILGVHQLQPG